MAARRLSAALRDGAGALPGLSGELWGQFRRGESPGFDEVAERLLARLELSQERARQYARLLSQSRRQAAAWLWDELLERELRVLAARAGISEATWWRFRRARVYPSGALAEKLARALGLTPAEEDELRGLFLRGKFDDAGPLKSAIQRGIAARGLTVTAFGRTPISPARPGGTSSRRTRPREPGTLLKLVIALRLARRMAGISGAHRERLLHGVRPRLSRLYAPRLRAARGPGAVCPRAAGPRCWRSSPSTPPPGERYFGNPIRPRPVTPPQA